MGGGRWRRLHAKKRVDGLNRLVAYVCACGVRVCEDMPPLRCGRHTHLFPCVCSPLTRPPKSRTPLALHRRTPHTHTHARHATCETGVNGHSPRRPPGPCQECARETREQRPRTSEPPGHAPVWWRAIQVAAACPTLHRQTMRAYRACACHGTDRQLRGEERRYDGANPRLDVVEARPPHAPRATATSPALFED